MIRSLRRRAAGTSLLLLGTALVYPASALGQGAAPAPSPSQPAPAQPAPSQPAPPPADPAEEDAEVVDVEAAPPPVPGDKGVLAGTVVDSANGEPIIEAQVTVVGTKFKALTDLDGNYRIVVPPGTYELRVFYEGHKPRRVQKAAVAKGQTLQVDVSLEPESAEPEPVREIEVQADRTSAATQILIRRNAANVGDAVSAQEIARTPDRNAAEAAKRVVGATVLDGRFVFVRGLGERYTNALLNGSPLPSPEPDRQAVPLDLFPSLVLSDISILKTFTPDMPGDFAGGSVSIHTRQPTETFQVSGTVSLGFNTETTFQDRLSYQGGSTDFLGIDSGRRGLPKGFPTYRIGTGIPKPDGSLTTDADVAAAGRQMNSSMSTNRSAAPPNHGLSVVAGGTLGLGSLGKLGVTAALSYSRKFTILRDVTIRRFDYNLDPSQVDQPFPYRASIDSKAEIGNDQVSWGGLAVLAWSPSPDHRITLTGLTSRSSDNEARILNATTYDGFVSEDTRLRFLSRGLFFGELGGEHKIRALRGMEVNYRISGSLATLDEPDTRQTIYNVSPLPDGTEIRDWEQNLNISGQHFFGSQSERSIGGALDVTQPILTGSTGLKLKAGGFVQVRDRRFDARRLRFSRLSPPYNLPPDELFSDANIGQGVTLSEWTFPDDQWVSTTGLYAGYVMADYSPLPWLRALGGARVESWSQSLESFDRFSPDTRTKSGQETLDALPALSVVFKTTKDSNLRASISRTVARPQLRELSPFLFIDYVGARDQQGNPFLKVSQVTNADLRFELFPGAADVVALSVFYKDFQRPIETIIAPAGSNETITFCNTTNATVLGMELEARKGLGFLSPALADLSPLANVTVSQSRVDLDIVTDADDLGPCNGLQGAQTSQVRPLVGQSPLVVNVGLDYANEGSGTRARLVYNVAAPRLRIAGSNGLLDTYEQPRHLLDLSIAQKIGEHVDIKLTAENLLQEPFRLTFGRDSRESDGVDAKGNPLLSNIVVRQQPGTTFNLSATFTH